MVNVEIVRFQRAYDRSKFDSGKPDLDDWLKTSAGQQEKSANTRTFLALRAQTDVVIGYYASTTYRLSLDEVAKAYGSGRRQYPVPAVLLARLAVDRSCQGAGVGMQLLIHALRDFARASQTIGFEVVVVHAIDEDAVTFYAKAGFTRFEDHPLHLFMPTRDLVATFGAT